MSRSKLYLMARREYLENVRTKTFWIGILSFPLILCLCIGVPILLLKTKESRAYAVLDQSGFILAAVEDGILADDMAELFAAADRQPPEGGPETLRQLSAVLAGMDEESRENLRLLATQTDPAPEEVQRLPEPARTWLRRDAAGLRSWWRGAPDEEMDKLNLKLNRDRFRRLDTPSGADVVEEFNRMIDDGRLFAYFVIGPDPVAGPEGCVYVSNNLTDNELRDWYSRRVSDIVRQRRLASERLDPQTVRWIQAPLNFASQKVGTAGAAEEVNKTDTARQWAPIAFVYALWIAIFTSSQMLLNNMIEEKSNRILEVLLSSVSAFELMAGKIAGMAASGLTVVFFWALTLISLVAVVGLGAAPGPVGFLGEIASDPLYLTSFVAYFLMGYLFYATLLAGIGSVCNSTKETQNLMTPIILPMLIPLLSMFSIVQDPNGILARILSFIPPFTPFVMMNRAAGPPAAWEYLATTILLLATIVVTLRGTAKVFRIGILMTGKPPRLLEIARWFALREGTTPPQQEQN